VNLRRRSARWVLLPRDVQAAPLRQSCARGAFAWSVVHEVLSMHVGPQFILVAMTLELSSDRARAHAIDRLEAALKRSHPRIRRVFVRVRKSDRLED
jgi:hypothetical protein